MQNSKLNSASDRVQSTENMQAELDPNFPRHVSFAGTNDGCHEDHDLGNSQKYLLLSSQTDSTVSNSSLKKKQLPSQNLKLSNRTDHGNPLIVDSNEAVHVATNSGD